MCNDFSKLRLLPDRLDYKGPPRKPGVDPRRGLDGKYGKTVRKCIEILGWVTKYHPNSKHFSENVEFSDMKEDWKGACDALGKPYIINSQDHSYTCRERAFWANIPLPDDFTMSPRTPATAWILAAKSKRCRQEDAYAPYR